MGFICVLVASLCFVLPGYVRSQEQEHPQIAVWMSHDLVQVDETVTFTCKVTRVSGSSDSSISLLKGVLKVGGLPISEFIAQSGILRRPYVNLPRYSIDTKTEGNEIIQTLTILGAQTVDSGNYGCSTPGLDDLYAVTHLSVYSKPGQVELSFNDTAIVNNSLNLLEDDFIPLTCRSAGGLPEPSMHLYIEDRPVATPYQNSGVLHQSVDNEFLVSTDKIIYCKENVAEKTDCPLNMNYEIIGESRTLKAKADFDGKQITCDVTMRVFTNDSSRASVGLNVLYKPNFACLNLRPVRANSTNVKLSCVVSANPPMDEANRQWTMGACSLTSQAIRPIVSSAEYSIQEKLITADGKKRTMELTIIKVTKDIFGKKFCLRVGNVHGVSTQEFSVQELSSGKGASLPTTSPLLLVGLSLLFIASKLFDEINN